ncbi:hypothetical protein [Winogradskyella endarachnes]|uniref:Uncharacterized protein n=1 Tax=Winogradskyella endarachnes TaxID=2681965 RepID=A0A6L6U5E4_9FLAO|nr:hypothetical protein [Winogradskyella endarachnes]MUU77079.1 hypothetical protein [Winogradskyella endarachnes]
MYRKNEVLDHHPEKAHQVVVNKMELYTEGESQQLIDFVWHDVQKKHSIKFILE